VYFVWRLRGTGNSSRRHAPSSPARPQHQRPGVNPFKWAPLPRRARTLYAPWYCATSSPIMKTFSSRIISSRMAELSASRTVNCAHGGVGAKVSGEPARGLLGPDPIRVTRVIRHTARRS